MAACADAGDELATCLTNELPACGPSASAIDDTAASALVTCMADNGCPMDGSAAAAGCQRGYCLPETVACSQATEGEEDCHVLLQCVDGDDCAKDFMTGEPTLGCIAGCLTIGTADAVEKYWELMLCVDAQCLGSPVYDDMELCFNEETDTGGACRWMFRDCLMSAVN